MITKEREFSGFQNDFTLKIGLLTSLFEKYSPYSQIVTKFNRLIFKSIN